MISRICSLCAKNDTEVIFKKGNLSADIINVVCKNCGLVFVNPQPTKEEYGAYHEDEFLSEKNILSTEQIFPKLRADLKLKKTIFKFIEEYIEDGQNVADIGCGFGALLDIIKKEKKINACGIELSNLDIAAAKRYYNLDLLKESLEVFSSKEENWGKFGLVILHHTFEHLPEPLVSLEQIKKILRPDGMLYIGVPNIMNIKKRPDIFFQIAHPFSYSPHSLKEILNRAGFGIIKFNEKAGYPGGMEIVAAMGGKNINDAGSKNGEDYKVVINYVQKTDRKFFFFRKMREVFLFWLPSGARTRIARFFYLLLKKI